MVLAHHRPVGRDHHHFQPVDGLELVGLGVGVTLCAPLNFLITERVSDNKSTALGILSLVRCVGMTLGPTIFAGFLTRSMSDFPARLFGNLQAVGISPSQVPASEIARMKGLQSFANLSDQIQQIPSAPIRNAVTQALHEVSRVGFANLYWSAFAISILSLLFVLITAAYRRRTETPGGAASAES